MNRQLPLNDFKNRIHEIKNIFSNCNSKNILIADSRYFSGNLIWDQVAQYIQQSNINLKNILYMSHQNNFKVQLFCEDLFKRETFLDQMLFFGIRTTHRSIVLYFGIEEENEKCVLRGQAANNLKKKFQNFDFIKYDEKTFKV